MVDFMYFSDIKMSFVEIGSFHLGGKTSFTLIKYTKYVTRNLCRQPPVR